ncbi:MAG: hypothetical protein WCA20_14790 [Candidatus Sulfotelmatobacter sp.]
MRVAVAIVPRLLMTVVAAGRNELIQNGGQVMLREGVKQSWLELNRTDRRRAPNDAQHRYAAQCQAPASGDDNTVTTVVTLRASPPCKRS